jgi:hypothetical protein
MVANKLKDIMVDPPRFIRDGVQPQLRGEHYHYHCFFFAISKCHVGTARVKEIQVIKIKILKIGDTLQHREKINSCKFHSLIYHTD